MADKMMRIAGRSSSGVARAFLVDEAGRTRVIKDIETRQLNEEPILIEPGESYNLRGIRGYSIYVITGRVTSTDKSLEIGVADFIAGSSKHLETEIVEIENSRFTSAVKIAKSKDLNIRITATGNNILEISDLFITSVEQLPYPEQKESYPAENTSGQPKKLTVDSSGRLQVLQEMRSKNIINEPVIVKPGIPYKLESTSAFSSYIISGRISTDQSSIRIGVSDEIAWGTMDADIERVKVQNNRFYTSVKMARSERVVITLITDEGKQSEVTHLFMTSVEGSVVGSGGSLSVEDEDGNESPLSAIKDDEGKAVLRVVDASPHAYDVSNDIYRVADLSDNAIQDRHMTIELAWRESAFEGKNKVKFNLNGRKDLLRGRKGYILYQGLSDGHDIYFEYRIGGSGPTIKEMIVENGTGAVDGGRPQKALIPEDCFPLPDFSKTTFEAKNNLVFESNGGDLHLLRAFVILM